MAQHNELGKQGEIIAQDFLKKKGYKILDANWKFGKYEIDIIAQTRNEIVFAEVKTRSSVLFGYPEDAVDDKRQRRMINAANAYVKYYKCNLEPRFDIISIIISDSETTINHIEDAFTSFIF